jgi:radical SAM protein with 4Fe4S-binding SPASM domain
MPKMHLKEPIKITLSITNACNQSCKICYSDCGSSPSRGELSREEWFKFIDYLIEHNFMQIYIEGGEPFLRPDMFDILSYCSRKVMTLIRTNGAFLNRENAHRLKSIGVGRVLIDVMGASAQTHDAFAGLKGSFERACDAIRLLADAGVHTDALTILTRQNAGELTAIARIAHRLGAERLGILRLYPIGRAKSRWREYSLPLADQMLAIQQLQPPPGLAVMQSWHPRNHNCCWQSATVDAVGNSIGCVYLREYVNYGNIRETTFLETWHNDPLYRRLRSAEVEHSCPDCEKTQGTGGGCRSTAFAFHRRWDAPDPYCTNLNDGVDLCVLP